MNYEKKDRNENILMILFLGVIGMWIWLPNKEELKVLLSALYMLPETAFSHIDYGYHAKKINHYKGYHFIEF